MIRVLLQSESPWQRNDAIAFFIYLCVSVYQEFFFKKSLEGVCTLRGTTVLSKRLGFFSPGLSNYLESVRVDIGFPVVQTDCSSFGRRTVK